jgi:hypothetical protein
MPDIVDIDMYRDGGSIQFRAVGTEADGLYRLQTPVLGVPQPLFRDGCKLELSSQEEIAILEVLREWYAEVATGAAVASLAELDAMKMWSNLPQNLVDVVPIFYIRSVIRRLSERCL